MNRLKSIFAAGPSALMLWSCGAALSEQAPENLADSATVAIEKVTNDSISFNKAYPQLLPENEVTEIYSTALAEYLDAIEKQDKKLPDSLFIHLHEDFPDIILPETINGVVISYITTENSEIKSEQNEHWVLLNVIGWVEGDTSDFIIVTFFDGEIPQHNCNIHLSRNAETNTFVSDSVTFEFVYSK